MAQQKKQQNRPKQPQDPYAQRSKQLASAVQRLRGWVGSDPSRTPELADALVTLTEHRLLGHAYPVAAPEAQESVKLAAQLLTANGPIGPYTSVADAARYVTAVVHLAVIQSAAGLSEAAADTVGSLAELREELGALPLVEALTPTAVVWALACSARGALAGGDLAQANAYADAALQRVAESGLRAEAEAAYVVIDTDRLTSDARWAAGLAEDAVTHLQLARDVYDGVVDGRLAQPARLSPALLQRLSEPLFGLYRDLADRLLGAGEVDLGLVTRRQLIELLRGVAPKEETARVQLAASVADLVRDLRAHGRTEEADLVAEELETIPATDRAAAAELDPGPARGTETVRWEQLDRFAAYAGAEGGAVGAAAAVEAQLQRAAAERLAAERAEAHRVEQERLEEARLAAERREAERAEAERLAAERAEAERADAARREVERIEAERAEAERRAAEEEAERQERKRRREERIEAHRLEQERLEAERRAAEQAELERREAERRAADPAELERLELEQLQAELAELERAEAEAAAAAEGAAEAQRIEAERRAAEEEAARVEEEQLARERRAQVRAAEERAKAEAWEAARREERRLEAVRAEAARREAARIEGERAEERRRAAEERAADEAAARREAERLASEQAEAERQAAEDELTRLELERIEAERLERERRERAERERAEAEWYEGERRAREETERLERLRHEEPAHAEAPAIEEPPAQERPIESTPTESGPDSQRDLPREDEPAQPVEDDLTVTHRAWHDARGRGDRKTAKALNERVVELLRPLAAEDLAEYGPRLLYALEELSSARLRSGELFASRAPAKEAKALAKALGRR